MRSLRGWVSTSVTSRLTVTKWGCCRRAPPLAIWLWGLESPRWLRKELPLGDGEVMEWMIAQDGRPRSSCGQLEHAITDCWQSREVADSEELYG